MVSIAVPSWTQRASLKNSLGVRHRKNYKEHKRRNVMMLEEVRPTQKNAALTTHITQFCFHENFTRDEEARKGETNDNFRDGVGLLGIIKYQIPHRYSMLKNPILLLFCHSVFQFWPLGAPSVWSCVLWTWSHLFVSISLLSGITRYSSFILYFSCPRPETNHFTKKP